jgi:hypothetical protein
MFPVEGKVLFKPFPRDKTIVVSQRVFLADAVIDNDPGAPRLPERTQVPTPKVAYVVARINNFSPDLF